MFHFQVHDVRSGSGRPDAFSPFAEAGRANLELLWRITEVFSPDLTSLLAAAQVNIPLVLISQYHKNTCKRYVTLLIDITVVVVSSSYILNCYQRTCVKYSYCSFFSNVPLPSPRHKKRLKPLEYPAGMHDKGVQIGVVRNGI